MRIDRSLCTWPHRIRYTFSVRGEEPIAIVNAALPDTAPPEPTETTLTVDDFGGVCEFDHGKCTFSSDGRLAGSLVFSQMEGATPIAKVCSRRPGRQ